MGMSIDDAHRILSNGLVNAPSEHEWCMAFKMAIEIMQKYQQMQTEYNARLKADLAAMLKELQLEIEEIETGGDTWELAIKDDCNAVIQKKIDALEYDMERGNDGD